MMMDWPEDYLLSLGTPLAGMLNPQTDSLSQKALPQEWEVNGEVTSGLQTLG